MGNISSASGLRTWRVLALHPRSERPDPAQLFIKPSGLYPTCQWDDKTVRRLILRRELAPRFPGKDEADEGNREECPICMLMYPMLNTTRCCAQRLCTECYLQLRPPRQNKEPCPFCKYRKVEVYFSGPRPVSDLNREEAATRAAAASQARMRDCPVAVPAPRSMSLPTQSASSVRTQQQTGIPVSHAVVHTCSLPHRTSAPATIVMTLGSFRTGDEDAMTDEADGGQSTSATSVAGRSTGTDTALATVASSASHSVSAPSPTSSVTRHAAASPSQSPALAPSSAEYHDSHDSQTLYVIRLSNCNPSSTAEELENAVPHPFRQINAFCAVCHTG